jgi:PAS domain S-box-containing protein
MPTNNPITDSFLKELHSPKQFELLFENLPDILFFVKNTSGQFVMANKTFVEQCGASSKEAILGKTDFDFFPDDRARAYTLDDERVMNSGQSIIDQIELGPEPDGTINWFVVTKVPLYSESGKIIGMAGVARDMRRAKHTLRPYNEMSAVVEYINAHYNESISTKHLAALIHLSASHFERKFKQAFHMTPSKYIQKTRIKVACTLLTSTNDTIASIAYACGFYDHAHFTKQFVKDMDVTPKEYRKKH